MNSIKANIWKFLRDAAITPEVYSGNLPQDPTYPITVFSIVSDLPINQTYEAGILAFRAARMQIEVYSKNVGDAESAIEAYVALMGNYKGLLGDGQSPETFADVSISDLGANPDMDFLEEPSLRTIEGRSRDFRILY